ncbi:hypothetical protein FPZ12_026545 [Amycolatopsis acidicola]|uniref:DUF4286 family protein n=1 Tax=Amycolatopsis acidicola TaxID=2596893 RepID=A0A5N0UV89_9PSEU|nr:hypothetical protein [Amycolatopsis acidicola]KAA9156736.1 hypothetical protein FPZ12_026545 [Amycolatopsis acidicola]
MSEGVLWLVRSAPAAGREAGYHRWYDEVHLPEVLAIPGVRSARRYESGDEFLAVYVLDSPEVAAEVGRRMRSGELAGSDAVEPRGSELWTPR